MQAAMPREGRDLSAAAPRQRGKARGSCCTPGMIEPIFFRHWHRERPGWPAEPPIDGRAAPQVQVFSLP